MSNPQLVFDLMKAQRDRSKLVQVQRMVTRRGKTFPQNFWVSPAEVKSSDRVIGGQQNLIPAKGSIPKPPKGVYDQKYFDSISQNKNDRSEAIAYLKECGVTWNENSNPGINWMHALHARNQKFGLNQAKISQPKTTSAQSVQQPSQANTQPTQASTANVLSAMSTLDLKTMSELNACANGKEKVVVLKKKLGQDGCVEFAKKVGVTWNEHPNKGINSMRMSMALAAEFDAVAGTVSYTTPSGPKGKVGAPEGNQNAKKDGAPVVEPDTIQITGSMSQRTQVLAELINKCVSQQDLELFAKTGMVAEDDEARDFIRNQLYHAYFEADSNKTGMMSRGWYNSTTWGKTSVEDVSSVFKGIPKKLLRKGMAVMADDRVNFNFASYLYPRETIPGVGRYTATQNTSNYGGQNFAGLLDMLGLFSQMATDDTTNVGYNGTNLEEYKEQMTTFGLEATGVVSVINHIAEKEPAVRAEADKMIQEYKELMGLTDGNTRSIGNAVALKWSDISDELEAYQQRVEAFDKAASVMKQLKLQYHMSDEDIETTLKLAYTDRDAVLRKWDGNRPISSYNHSYDTITDSSGNPVSLRKILGDITLSSGKDLWSQMDFYYSSDTSHVVAAMIKTGKSFENIKEDDMAGIEVSTPYSVKNHLEQTKTKAERYKSMDKDRFVALKRKVLEMSGQKVQKWDYASDSWKDEDTDSWTADDWDSYLKETHWRSSYYRTVASSPNPERDAIVANMKYTLDTMSMLSQIQRNCAADITPSKANDDGANPAANFDYFVGGTGTSLYWDTPKLSGAEINQRVKTQLDNSPVLTMRQLENMRKYAEATGDNTAKDETDRKCGNAVCFSFSAHNKMTAMNGSPFYDIAFQQMSQIASYAPQMKNTRVKTQEQVDKIVADKMNYKPYVAPDEVAAGSGELQGAELRQLREKVLSSAHCSLKTAQGEERTKMESRVKHDWDKEKRDSSGKRLYGYISFKSNGVYKVNNSSAQETFQKNVEKVKQTSPGQVNGSNYDTKVHSLFHGTDFRGACGILGVDGHFRAPKNSEDARRNGQKYAGGMLGPGVYLADLAGKSSGYFGNWGAGYDKRGALLVCDVLLGDHLSAPDSSSVKYRMDVDSVSMKSGTHTGQRVLRADEWCVRRNDYVSPQYIIDAEAIRRNV